MKILLTHRYFWPDSPPYAAMLKDLAGHLARAGHDVHVFATMPSYRGSATDGASSGERLNGFAVRRCQVIRNEKRHVLLRVVNVLIYCATLFVAVLRTRPDVVTASTFPPVVAGWTASLAARLCGAHFVYHMQDVHPEVSKYSGGRQGRGLVFRLLRMMDNQTLRRASGIVVLSEDMADTLASRGIGKLPITVINNFMLEAAADQDPPRHLVKRTGTRRVIFAGNLGRFQNLETLTEGVALCLEEHRDLELLFLGDGEALPVLQSRWDGHDRIIFGPFLPFAQAKGLIAGADVGLVSLAPDIFRVSYPSKVLTYAGLGVPMLALIEPESHLAHQFKTLGIGVVPGSTEPADIAAALGALLAKPDRSAALAGFVETVAAPEAAFRRWDELLAGIAAGQAGVEKVVNQCS